MEKQQRREIRNVSGILGAAILLFLLLGTGLSYLARRGMQMPVFKDQFWALSLFQIIYTFLAVMGPFFLATFAIRKVQDTPRDSLTPFRKSKDYKLFLAAISIGLMAALIGDLLTGAFTMWLDGRGYTFNVSDVKNPQGGLDWVWAILAYAAVPAVCEEYAFRGVILQSLRKYGDGLAIGISSLLFALMHGNAAQAPFALLLGIVMGRLAIATDSLWTSIAVHFLNNTYATVFNALQERGDTQTVMAGMVTVYTVVFVMGLLALFYLYAIYHWGSKEMLYSPGDTVPEKRKYRHQAELHTITSIPMLAGLVFLIRMVVLTIVPKGG